MSSKKGLGRGLGAIVSLAPVQADGAARIDEAIRASAGPSVLALSGDSFDEIVRAGAAGKPLAPPSSRRDAQPMCPPPGGGFAPPLDLRVGATSGPRNPEPTPVSADPVPQGGPTAELVAATGGGAETGPVVSLSAAVPPEGAIVTCDAADIAIAAHVPEESAEACAAEVPCADAAAVDSDAMAAARRAVQYSLFDAPVAPPAPEVVAATVTEHVGDVSVSIDAPAETAVTAESPAPVAVEEPIPPVVSSEPPEAPVAVAVFIPAAPVAAPADAPPAFTDDVLYFDDTILLDDADVSPAPAPPALAAPAAPPASAAPPPATFTDDAVLIDDVFIDDAVVGFVLPDVEME